jgi:hypothetical protein
LGLLAVAIEQSLFRFREPFGHFSPSTLEA